MEVSSHALSLNRADGIRFAVAAFTNLTQDHLDFHADMEDYFLAKRPLFDGRSRRSAAVINVDDPYGDRLAAEFDADHLLGQRATDGPTCARVDLALRRRPGSRFRLRRPRTARSRSTLPLPGRFNVENALARARLRVARSASAGRRGRGARASADRVPGRFEPVDEGQPFAVLVDYAHTPDSLENVLAAARQITAPAGG